MQAGCRPRPSAGLPSESRRGHQRARRRHAVEACVEACRRASARCVHLLHEGAASVMYSTSTSVVVACVWSVRRVRATRWTTVPAGIGSGEYGAL